MGWGLICLPAGSQVGIFGVAFVYGGGGGVADDAIVPDDSDEEADHFLAGDLDSAAGGAIHFVAIGGQTDAPSALAIGPDVLAFAFDEGFLAAVVLKDAEELDDGGAAGVADGGEVDLDELLLGDALTVCAPAIDPVRVGFTTRLQSVGFDADVILGEPVVGSDFYALGREFWGRRDRGLGWGERSLGSGAVAARRRGILWRQPGSHQIDRITHAGGEGEAGRYDP